MSASIKFTRSQTRAAIEVLSNSKMVREWVEGMAKAYNVDLTTPEGQEFYRKQAEHIAKRLIK